MTACVKCGYDPDAVVIGRWAFTLDKRLSSANLRTVNAGPARWRYAKERDAWQWLVKAGRLEHRIPAAVAKRRVTIERVRAGRCQEMDRDNLVAGAKPLVDAIAREGLLVSDKPEWLELHVMQRRGDSNVTIVTIENLGNQLDPAR